MQFSCGAQGQVFQLLQQALSPPSHLPALLGITLLKHYLNGAKDMVLFTVLALHAGDSGLDPSTTQLGGGQELKMLSWFFFSLTLQVICLDVFRGFLCVSVSLSVCTSIFCFLFDSLLFCSFVCFVLLKFVFILFY